MRSFCLILVVIRLPRRVFLLPKGVVLRSFNPSLDHVFCHHPCVNHRRPGVAGEFATVKTFRAGVDNADSVVRSAAQSDGIRLSDATDGDARVDLKLLKNISFRVSGDSVFDGAQIEVDNAELLAADVRLGVRRTHYREVV